MVVVNQDNTDGTRPPEKGSHTMATTKKQQTTEDRKQLGQAAYDAYTEAGHNYTAAARTPGIAPMTARSRELRHLKNQAEAAKAEKAEKAKARRAAKKEVATK